MIIDAHSHIGFSDPLKGSVDNLLASMEKAGIEKAMVFAGKIGHCTTNDLLESVRGYTDILYPIGSFSALDLLPDVEFIEQLLREKKIFGLKFYTGYEYFYPTDEKLYPYFELLSIYNRPAIFHMGDTYKKVVTAKLKYAHPLAIDEVAVEFPKMKIIIAHVGYPWIIETAEVCAKNDNVYTDTSGFVYGPFTPIDREVFTKIIDYFKQHAPIASCLLFGTDWPISNQQSYVQTMSDLLPGDIQQQIFSENSIRAFGLNQQA
ncbi:MAG: hypothetical protein RIQ54_401 [Candidatus Parcubacteria bacterium]|jgi:predicted TIM-barrel fold metal-dependent hydrolase